MTAPAAAPPNAVQIAIRRVAFGDSLDADMATSAFETVMRGEATSAQIAALLIGLRVKGETADEVTGAARAMRGAMLRLPVTSNEDLVDTCGTGGGAVPTFNISTAAALLAAGAGVRIAKHGNRSFTTQSGSADVLEQLGVTLEAPVELAARALEEAGIAFMFAPAMHPAMRHVGPVRRELGIPTVMNIVGPLANPAGAARQVVGVAERKRMPLLAGALASLGAVHAIVVHGEPGMDEISPVGPTHVAEVRDGSVSEWTMRPEEYGFGGFAPAELVGGTPADNARIIVDVLEGRGKPAATAAVILNAAGALYVAPGSRSFADCVAAAAGALASGAGMRALDRMRRAYAQR
ncbi:MAG TPA: anthranilate phosphoribosyltransferase [Gemmatimonadaceae bacterium]|nr:anthranilate phosphoribosyltransferase [Gemmatimonadaceae bacterium]